MSDIDNFNTISRVRRLSSRRNTPERARRHRLAVALRKEQIRHGLSDDELAELMGVHPKTMLDWFSGLSVPTGPRLDSATQMLTLLHRSTPGTPVKPPPPAPPIPTPSRTLPPTTPAAPPPPPKATHDPLPPLEKIRPPSWETPDRGRTRRPRLLPQLERAHRMAYLLGALIPVAFVAGFITALVVMP